MSGLGNNSPSPVLLAHLQNAVANSQTLRGVLLWLFATLPFPALEGEVQFQKMVALLPLK